MEVLYPHCAGLDVHKRTVVACIAHTDGRGHATWTTQTWGTTTPDLLALQAWLVTEHVTHVAMEATGSYWKPVYNLLDGVFTTWVVNPAHIKNVPGRKTDINDAEWIADLLRHGLLTPSFIPDRPQRELRELTRQRTQWLAERSREVNRVHKVLEGANIKLSSVVTDVLGVSGRRMLDALVAGTTDPATLAALADPRLRSTPAVLQAALTV
jgi:transposase